MWLDNVCWVIFFMTRNITDKTSWMLRGKGWEINVLQAHMHPYISFMSQDEVYITTSQVNLTIAKYFVQFLLHKGKEYSYKN